MKETQQRSSWEILPSSRKVWCHDCLSCSVSSKTGHISPTEMMRDERCERRREERGERDNKDNSYLGHVNLHHSVPRRVFPLEQSWDRTLSKYLRWTTRQCINTYKMLQSNWEWWPQSPQIWGCRPSSCSAVSRCSWSLQTGGSRPPAEHLAAAQPAGRRSSPCCGSWRHSARASSWRWGPWTPGSPAGRCWSSPCRAPPQPADRPRCWRRTWCSLQGKERWWEVSGVFLT